jgi:hypothetical protein
LLSGFCINDDINKDDFFVGDVPNLSDTKLFIEKKGKEINGIKS